MFQIKFLLIVLIYSIALPSLLSQDLAGRLAAKNRVMHALIERRAMLPPNKWTDRDKYELPGDLEEELITAKTGLEILGVLDVKEKYCELREDDLALKAQVAWAEGFFGEARKAAKRTPLEALIDALDRQRRGSVGSNDLTPMEIIHQNGFSIIDVYVTWAPFRSILLENDIKTIFDRDDYLLSGDLPDGFQSEWLNGHLGPAAKWDRAWDSAWAQDDLKAIHGLFKRLPNYQQEGLTKAQREELSRRQSLDWDLPYRWAKMPYKDDLGGALGPAFLARVSMARYLQRGQVEEAQERLANFKPTPRDIYEISLGLESVGTEKALTQLLQESPELALDPKVPGWSSELAEQRLSRVKNKLEQMKNLRIEQQRAAERQAEAEKAELSRRETERQRAERRMEVAMKLEVQREKAAKEATAERKREKEEEEAREIADYTGGSSNVPRFTAHRLNALYQQNEVNADARIQGKIIVVEGTVNKISKNVFGQIYIVISTGDSFQDLLANCRDEDAEQISKITPGQRIRVIGVVLGMVVQSVTLSDCHILRL